MVEQYWADAATKNCVWLFQVKYDEYGERGCTCGAYEWDKEENDEIKIHDCNCTVTTWRTEGVFLTREEADRHGESRPYAWGKKNEGWRIWGVMCHGLMAELLGKHNKEFEDKVEYITERDYTTHKVKPCHDAMFHEIPCLEMEDQYGFFKSEADIRPGHCTWIDKKKVERLYKLFRSL